LGDRLHQVRLAEAGPAVDEQRVVRLRGSFGDRERGRMREPVRGTDDEQIEDVLRVQPRLESAWDSFCRERRGCLLGRLEPAFGDAKVDSPLGTWFR
jgi:hypothetical protein